MKTPPQSGGFFGDDGLNGGTFNDSLRGGIGDAVPQRAQPGDPRLADPAISRHDNAVP
ncbi:MAG: hypothetical protein ABI832_17675 [bacterium]